MVIIISYLKLFYYSKKKKLTLALLEAMGDYSVLHSTFLSESMINSLISCSVIILLKQTYKQVYLPSSLLGNEEKVQTIYKNP